MPEIKLKHVVSFSSEDKVHKAENLLNPETYRKWKCATPGEKNASIILQFEKATKIHSIDIGNEGSAFVEVLVGRSSDTVKDYQVLLVASSFMSPIESRNEQHNNRVRMFGPEKLAQNFKEEKWDCAQVVCTQPFNKNITYGLSFIKFHSPPEKIVERPAETESKTTTVKLGAFKIKYDDDEEGDSVPLVSSWLERKNKIINSSLQKSDRDTPSFAAAVLSSNDSPKPTSQNPVKRKLVDSDSNKPPAKKESPSIRVNKDKVGYRDILGSKNSEESNTHQSKMAKLGSKDLFGLKTPNSNSPTTSKKPKDIFGLNTSNSNSPTTSRKPISKVIEESKAKHKDKTNSKPRFNELMKGVVFVISGFVNPLRSEIREKGLEMGAKYKGDWDHTCTHLVCAFVNTPKYIQVQGENGKIVKKDWIIDCHKKRALLPWRDYMLGRYARNDSESSESEEEVVQPKTKISTPLVNGSSKTNSTLPSPAPKKLDKTNSKRVLADEYDDSETEDEDALKDFLADTDVEADSGGDTEDEIRKVEEKIKQKNSMTVPAVISLEGDDCLESDEDSGSLLQTKPDTSHLPLPELPNLFKSKHFYLYGDFSEAKLHNLKRFITAYNGILEDYMADSVKYVITESKWDSNFEQALAENEDLIFVKPEWVFKCHEKAKLVPYQPHIIIPDS